MIAKTQENSKTENARGTIALNITPKDDKVNEK
jgi:hypothetical protein